MEPDTRPDGPTPRKRRKVRLEDIPGLKPASEIEPYWRLKDIARFLNCSMRWLETARASGRLPAPDFEDGRMLRWKRSTITAWLDSGGRGVA